MNLKRCDMQTFSSVCKGKKLACYGIGGEFQRILKNYQGYGWVNDICYLVDSNPLRNGEKMIVNDREYMIFSLEHFLQEDLKDVIMFVTCTAYIEVVKSLNAIGRLDNMECYLFHFMYALSEGEDYAIQRTEQMLIPPVIHYCWFGGNELPDLYKRCIQSWHEKCPDYEIREWNESNCDVNEIAFTKEAYDCKKYGFVPDYFRLKIIYENGGIYLDTDVEVLKNLDDLRYNKAFCGMEYPGEAALGLGFGAEKGNETIHYLMQRYETMHFIQEDGSLDETISPIYQTKDLMQIGMQYGSKIQNISGLTIYPVDVLSPKNVYTGETILTENSYALHHYDGSWVDSESRKKKQHYILQAKEVLSRF